MIPQEIIKKIKRVHLASSRTVNSLMAGQYRSVFRGVGIEFEEVREYSPGDEIKSIDWKVSARLGRPFVKVYREERERIVMLLVDMSASQRFGTLSGLKLEKAAEAASVLAFSAIKNNDKVGVIFFTDKVEKYIPPKKGASHIWRLIKEMFTYEPESRGTDLTAALDFLATVSRKRTVTFIVSDFLTDFRVNTLKTVQRRHEVIGVMIHDHGDTHLPEKGIVTLECFETGDILVLDASDKKTRVFYKNRVQDMHRSVMETLKRCKVDVIDMDTREPVSDTLTAYFRLREKRMK
ncbi:MAG: DUF58 domain-containing protein [Pseudomonadota bacterium]